MRLLSRDDLRLSVYIALKVAPKPMRGSSDHSVETLASYLIEKVFGDAALVVVPSDVLAGDYGSKPGRWGVTEPHPFPELL